MIIENLQPNNLLIPYKFHVAFYYIAVTLTTVGYGDFYPYTDEGRMFIFVLLLYAIVIKIPRLMNDLLRLMSLKSVYERRVYNTNVEIPHVIITGQVTL
jgi:potassium large conductance calcium-activated channel subfamily M alpha protein 1